MTNIQAIILGIVEGLTEFLPISSTGHLTLVSHFLNIVQNEQFIVFEIAIQLGAILAMFVIYWKRFLEIDLIKKLIIAFLPTGILGVLVFKHLKVLLTSELIIGFTLLVGGVILILVEKKYKKSIADRKVQIENISYKKAFILGLAQSLAMIPGVSRSGTVIVAGLLMNLERKILVDFTFLLAVPTMSAATVYSLYKNREILSTENFFNITIGFISAFIVALLVIKFFLNYIKKYDFIPFGFYRIVLGMIIIQIFI